MDRLEALEVFRAIVDQGGITAAADKLGASKAMVSKTLSGLEERLGARLLERTTRSQSLSELGELVYRQSETLLEGYAALENQVREQQGQAQGLLRVSVPQSFPIKPIAALLHRLTVKEPNLRIELHRSDSFVHLIDQGFDVALRMSNLSDSQMIARRLCTLTTGLFASPGYLGHHGVPQTPMDLKAHQCVLDSNIRPKRHLGVVVDGEQIALPVSGAIEVNGVEASVALAMLDAGIIAAPTVTVVEALRQGHLVPVLEPYWLPAMALHAVYPARQHLPLKVRRFVDLAAEMLSNCEGGANPAALAGTAQSQGT